MSRTLQLLNYKITSIKKNMMNSSDIDVLHKFHTQCHNRYLSLLPLLSQLSRSYLILGKHLSTDSDDKTRERFKRRTRRLNTNDIRSSPASSNYDKLGINPNASQKEIKSAYFKMSKLYHPDINDTMEATNKFREVSEAYEVLSNADSKLSYDRTMFGPNFHNPSTYTYNGYNNNKWRDDNDGEDYTLKWKQRQQEKQKKDFSNNKWQTDNNSGDYRQQRQRKASGDYTDEDYIKYKKYRGYDYMDYKAAEDFFRNQYNEKYEKMLYEEREKERLKDLEKYTKLANKHRKSNVIVVIPVAFFIMLFYFIRYLVEDVDYSEYFVDRSASINNNNGSVQQRENGNNTSENRQSTHNK